MLPDVPVFSIKDGGGRLHNDINILPLDISLIFCLKSTVVNIKMDEDNYMTTTVAGCVVIESLTHDTGNDSGAKQIPIEKFVLCRSECFFPSILVFSSFNS